MDIDFLNKIISVLASKATHLQSSIHLEQNAAEGFDIKFTYLFCSN